MARPAKPIGSGTGTYTKEETALRKAAETKLKGTGKKLVPPKYMTDAQKKLYRKIVSMLKAADTLGAIDTWILEQTVTAIDRLQELNTIINAKAQMMLDKDVQAAIKINTTIFFRGCNELGLSPQARAKLGIIAAKKEDESPLGELMGDG